MGKGAIFHTKDERRKGVMFQCVSVVPSCKNVDVHFWQVGGPAQETWLYTQKKQHEFMKIWADF